MFGYVGEAGGGCRSVVALEQSMQRRSRQMRDGRLEGIKAIVERQQRMLAERNSESFLLGAEYR